MYRPHLRARASQALTAPLDSDLIMSDVTKLQGWDAVPNTPQTDLMVRAVLTEMGWGSVENAPQTETQSVPEVINLAEFLDDDDADPMMIEGNTSII